MRLAPPLLLALALLASGCAHRDPARLNAAWEAMPLDWGDVLRAHRVSPSEVVGVDISGGVLNLRTRQEGLLRFVPLGIMAQEGGGVVSSRKEWLSAPALAPDAVGWATVAGAGAAGLLVIMPIYQFQEELWHAYDEVLHPDAWAAAETGRRWLTLGGRVPILSDVLWHATYYIDPRELAAKARKILMFGAAPNLDCPAARERWESLLAWLGWHRASERARAAGLDYVPPAWIAAEAEALRGAEIVPAGDYWHPAFWPQALGPADAPDGPTTLPRIWR